MQTVQTRPSVSVFAELSEGSKAGHGFDWDRDYGGTFRECPSAFWLAPDADRDLPHVPITGPGPAPKVTGQPITERERCEDRVLGATLAILAAGPVFCLAAVADELLSKTLFSGNFANFWMLMMLPFAVVIGAVLALLPVTLGVLFMGKAGEWDDGWRHPLWWATSGLLFGSLLAWPFSDSIDDLSIMAITGTVCALIARWKVRWKAPSQPARSTRAPAVAISACPAK